MGEFGLVFGCSCLYSDGVPGFDIVELGSLLGFVLIGYTQGCLCLMLVITLQSKSHCLYVMSQRYICEVLVRVVIVLLLCSINCCFM